MKNNSHIESKIKALPGQPGVYQFYDRTGTVIYIGKAKNLKKRVSSYFTKRKFDSYKIKILVERVYDIQIIIVDTEFMP